MPAGLSVNVPGVDVEDAARALFARVDANQDGCFSRAELIKALRKDETIRRALQLPDHIGDEDRAAFEAVFQGMDVNDNRAVTEDEFVAFMSQSVASAFAGLPTPSLEQDEQACTPPAIEFKHDAQAEADAALEVALSLIAQMGESEISHLDAALLERKRKLGLEPQPALLRYKAMRKAQLRTGFDQSLNRKLQLVVTAGDSAGPGFTCDEDLTVTKLDTANPRGCLAAEAGVRVGMRCTHFQDEPISTRERIIEMQDNEAKPWKFTFTDKAGTLEEGAVVTALEQRVNELGVVRVRCERGWVSVQSADKKRTNHVEIMRPLATAYVRPLACDKWHHSAHADGNNREVWLCRAWE